MPQRSNSRDFDAKQPGTATTGKDNNVAHSNSSSNGHQRSTVASQSDYSRAVLKTRGEIEAAICEGISRFEQDYMGRGPKDINTYLLEDLLVVRLKGVLTVAEQQLVKSLPAEKGRDLLKQVRTHLIETARPIIEAMVTDIVGVPVQSLHHDISTSSGEEVMVFSLKEVPNYREAKRK